MASQASTSKSKPLVADTDEMIKELHLDMVVELSQHFTPSLKKPWDEVLTHLSLFLKPADLKQDSFTGICEKLMSKGIIDYGKYDKLYKVIQKIDVRPAEIIEKTSEKIHDLQAQGPLDNNQRRTGEDNSPRTEEDNQKTARQEDTATALTREIQHLQDPPTSQPSKMNVKRSADQMENICEYHAQMIEELGDLFSRKQWRSICNKVKIKNYVSTRDMDDVGNMENLCKTLKRKGVIKHGEYKKLRAILVAFDVEAGKIIDDVTSKIRQEMEGPSPARQPRMEDRSTVTQTAYQRALAERPTYKMESTPRGYCLIINNRDYTIDSMMDPRIGTDVNRDELRAMFIELGFQVDAKDNVTGQAMRDTLKEFAVCEGLTTVDSLVVAFLCHGDSEKIYGVDGVPLNLEQDIFKVFSPRQCPVMIGKPKLLLINSCRGEQRDVRYSAPTTIGGTVPVDATKGDVYLACALPQDGNTVVTTFQDLYIAYSTFHGHVSYRNREKGSWYIRKLVEVFRAQAALCDIHALMTQVNREVTGIHDPQSMEVQVPAPCTTLTKDWYFNPPAAV